MRSYIKDGVRFVSGPAAMAIAYPIIKDIYEEVGFDCGLTGGIEQHEPPSKHVTGGAHDFRIRHLPDGVDQDIASMIQEQLGDGFDVVLESTHIHVEYDPKS